MATKQVKWSNTVDFEFKPKGKTSQQIYYNSLRKISRDLINEVIENIYPIRISKISSNGDAILTQTTKLNSMYDVYELGEKLYDPYTKEFLGYDEVKTGRIKTVRSLAKVSYAKVIDGYVKRNSICRKVKSKKKVQKKGTKTDVLIQDFKFETKINRYTRQILAKTQLLKQIKQSVNGSANYHVISKDTAYEEMSTSDDTSLKYFQILPIIKKFKVFTTSKKLEDIEVFENRDYADIALSIKVIDKKGKVVFQTTKEKKYSNAWTANKKLKRTSPSIKIIKKITNEIVSDALNDFFNKTAGHFISVVEVGDEIVYLEIDAGANIDIQEGDKYPVYKRPILKTNKRTGKTHLRYSKKIATVKIDGVFDDGIEAIVIQGKISDIKEGDVLRIRKRRK
jgi:hypothetical protein